MLHLGQRTNQYIIPLRTDIYTCNYSRSTNLIMMYRNLKMGQLRRFYFTRSKFASSESGDTVIISVLITTPHV